VRIDNSCRLGVVGALVSTALLSAAAIAAPQSYSGQGTAVRGTVLGQSIVLADTGPLPSKGGRLEAFMSRADVGDNISAVVLHAATRGEGDHSSTEASVGNLNFRVSQLGDFAITADVISSTATATCGPPSPCGDSPDAFGDARIVGLRIAGVEQQVTGEPNQVIDLGPLGSIIINEQIFDGPSDITVNALHATLLNPDGTQLADVIIASSHADVVCEK
jgi:hypothetical protein